jgi:hypothetical protein
MRPLLVVATSLIAIASAAAPGGRARAAAPVGPLHCIPMIVKDNSETAGLPAGGPREALSVPLAVVPIASHDPRDAIAVFAEIGVGRGTTWGLLS